MTHLSTVNADKTHCPQGHEYTDENTYLFRGWRSCRECHRVHARESARRRRKIKRDTALRARETEVASDA